MEAKKGIKTSQLLNIILFITLALVILFGYYYINKVNPIETARETVAPVNPDAPPDYLFSIYGEGTNRIVQPSNVYVADNRIFVSDRGRQKVVVFNYNGEYLFDIGANTLAEPHGVVMVNGELYVADVGTRLIHVFDSNGQFLRYFAEKKPYKPLDIKYRDGKFYVTDAVRQLVYVYDETGKELMSIGGRNNENIKQEGKFYYIWGVALDSKGDIYLSDPNLNRIQVFDSQGKFIKVLASKLENNEGGFSIPRGIYIDKNDNLFAASMLGNRIDVMKPDGTRKFGFSQTAPNDKPLQGPGAVFVDNNNRIFVADQLNSRIAVYKAK